jgi:hypothetical protein
MRTTIWIKSIAAGLATAAAIALGMQLAAAAPASPAGSPLTRAQVLHIALTEAKDSQDPHPKRIEMVTGTLASAEQVLEAKDTPGSLQSNSESVDVVVMRGHFHIDAPHPRGHPIGPGKVLGLILDAHTGSVEVRSLSDVVPALSHLGRVTRLR